MSKSRIVLALTFTVVLVGVVLTVTGRTESQPLTSEALDSLTRLQQAPAAAGQAIYEGSVFALDGRTTPLFRYERRVQPVAGGLKSTHITFDPAGKVVVTQSATHSDAYELTRAEMVHGQTGVSGSVQANGDQLTFTLVEGGTSSVATERATAPVVSGPTMFGYIVTHWDELMRGEALPIRFAIIERQETIGFTLDRIPAAPGRTAIRMRASNWLMRLAVPSTAFEFDTATRKIIEYIGRVPPMEVINGGLKTLDARVSYEFKAPAFR